MSRHSTRFNKRDQVEPSILQALARMAVPVYEAPPLDLWCWLGRWVPVEIKTGKAPLTEGQSQFIAECIDAGRPCAVWRSTADAVESVQQWRQKA